MAKLKKDKVLQVDNFQKKMKIGNNFYDVDVEKKSYKEIQNVKSKGYFFTGKKKQIVRSYSDSEYFYENKMIGSKIRDLEREEYYDLQDSAPFSVMGQWLSDNIMRYICIILCVVCLTGGLNLVTKSIKTGVYVGDSVQSVPTYEWVLNQDTNQYEWVLVEVPQIDYEVYVPDFSFNYFLTKLQQFANAPLVRSAADTLQIISNIWQQGNIEFSVSFPSWLSWLQVFLESLIKIVSTLVFIVGFAIQAIVIFGYLVVFVIQVLLFR